MTDRGSSTIDAGNRGSHLDETSFRRLAALVHGDCGIVLSESKRNLVVSRLSRRLRELNFRAFRDYCRFIESDQGVAERRNLASLLTTNVTRFFRENHHFEALENDVLPPLLARAKNGGRVRIWSAGCSSGEEPYSIAIKVLEQMPDVAKYDVRILGTDIDSDVIEKGRNGVYTNLDDTSLPIAVREQYFLPCDARPGAVEVSAKVKEIVVLSELNLMSEWPMRGPFDVIFCRNVVIYFDAETQDLLWRRFERILAPDGHFFIGHSERVNTDDCIEFVSSGVTQYRRAQQSEPWHERNTM